MPDHRLPKIVFYGELLEGKRSQGDQKKSFKDSLKTSLKAFGINHHAWECEANDKIAWCPALRKGAVACEASLNNLAEQRRLARKTLQMNSSSAASILCPHCSNVFRARIGLISHLRSHRLK